MEFYEIDLYINLLKLSKKLSEEPVSLESSRVLAKVPVPVLQNTTGWHSDDALRHHLSIVSAHLTNMYVDAELSEAKTDSIDATEKVDDDETRKD